LLRGGPSGHAPTAARVVLFPSIRSCPILSPSRLACDVSTLLLLWHNRRYYAQMITPASLFIPFHCPYPNPPLPWPIPPPPCRFCPRLRWQQDRQLSADAVAAGVRHQRNGQQGEALRCYAKALQAQPDNVDAYVARGALHTTNGRYEAAVKDLRCAHVGQKSPLPGIFYLPCLTFCLLCLTFLSLSTSRRLSPSPNAAINSCCWGALGTGPAGTGPRPPQRGRIPAEDVYTSRAGTRNGRQTDRRC